MTKVAPDLFAWADQQPPETVIMFIERRKALPRWQAIRLKPFAGYDRAVARLSGKMPPAPILAFPHRHPASPGSYSPDTAARTG